MFTKDIPYLCNKTSNRIRDRFHGHKEPHAYIYIVTQVTQPLTSKYPVQAYLKVANGRLVGYGVHKHSWSIVSLS